MDANWSFKWIWTSIWLMVHATHLINRFQLCFFASIGIIKINATRKFFRCIRLLFFIKNTRIVTVKLQWRVIWICWLLFIFSSLYNWTRQLQGESTHNWLLFWIQMLCQNWVDGFKQSYLELWARLSVFIVSQNVIVNFRNLTRIISLYMKHIIWMIWFI